ncbi:MAG TPA: ChaN family lipoprotein [Gammaproteobacteria bacterium]|nr:ChaN family lipoprotein [Gammaproteobacteria bacterium]
MRKPIPRALRLAVGVTALLVAISGPVPAASQGEKGGGQSIFRLADGKRVPFSSMMDDLSGADIVLVGEEHDSHANHRAQQQVIAALLGRGLVAVGMESFPSTRQDALDAWWRGRNETFPDFLDRVDWFRVWGLSPALYRPILATVRMNRVPLYGINVPRSWIDVVARKGLEGLDRDQRRRIGPVAPPPPAYRKALRESLASHHGGPGEKGFIQAQITWDAAMAGGLLKAKREHPRAVVVGIVGKGHVEGGYGIPRQVRTRNGDLKVRTVLPFAPEAEDRPGKGDADYAWAMAPERASDPVQIGVVLDTAKGGGGVAIQRVKEGYPAEKAGLQAGDRILAVDGSKTSDATRLIYAIRQHQWGGCLRLRIRRKGAMHTLTVVLERPQETPSSGQSE